MEGHSETAQEDTPEVDGGVHRLEEQVGEEGQERPIGDDGEVPSDPRAFSEV